MRITAHHTHLFPKSVRPDGALDALLPLLDDCGIDDCVVFAPFAKQMSDLGESPNRWLKKEIAHCDRVFGFGTVDFEKGDLAGQVQEAAELGFRGLKLHPAYQHFNILSDEAHQVYEQAEKLGLFLSFHTGVHWDRIANYNVLMFDEVAYLHRKLRFSMEHIGGYSFIRDGLAVLANNNSNKANPQVFGGFTSIFSTGTNYLWYLTPEERALALRMAGENGIIFGLDFPYNRQPEIVEGIEAVKAMNCSQEAEEKILGGNLRRIIGIDD